MPYKVRPLHGKWVVVSEGTGRILGTHPTEAAARDQQKAIYANEGKAKKKKK